MKDGLYTALLFIYSIVNPGLYDDNPPTVDIEIQNPSLLVFSKTQKGKYRHKSIPAGLDALRVISRNSGWDLFSTENGAIFNDTDLDKFDLVVFLSTSGNILSPDQKKSLARFVENGGGLYAIHSASDTEHYWKWYKKALVGMYRSHIAPVSARLSKPIEHPTTASLPQQWSIEDEWYQFDPSPESGATIVLTLDAYSFEGISTNQPVMWFRDVAAGRVFYNALGHKPEVFSNPEFIAQLRDSLSWTGRLAETDQQ